MQVFFFYVILCHLDLYDLIFSDISDDLQKIAIKSTKVIMITVFFLSCRMFSLHFKIRFSQLCEVGKAEATPFLFTHKIMEVQGNYVTPQFHLDTKFADFPFLLLIETIKARGRNAGHCLQSLLISIPELETINKESN